MRKQTQLTCRSLPLWPGCGGRRTPASVRRGEATPGLPLPGGPSSRGRCAGRRLPAPGRAPGEGLGSATAGAMSPGLAPAPGSPPSPLPSAFGLGTVLGSEWRLTESGRGEAEPERASRQRRAVRERVWRQGTAKHGRGGGGCTPQAGREGRASATCWPCPERPWHRCSQARSWEARHGLREQQVAFSIHFRGRGRLVQEPPRVGWPQPPLPLCTLHSDFLGPPAHTVSVFRP